MKKAYAPLRIWMLFLVLLSHTGILSAQVPHCKLGFQFFPYFCDPDSVVLSVLAFGGADPYTYLWSTGDTTQSIVVPNDGMNLYCVTITGSNGCTLSNCLSTGNLVTPSLYVTDPSSCGLPVLLEIDWPWLAPSGLMYNWSTGATTPTIIATSTGVYSVTLTDTYGCSYVLIDSLVISPIPDPQIIGPTSLCSGQPVTLSILGGPFEAYEWLPSGETDPTIVITGPGTYSVTVWTIPGPCEGTDTIIITGDGNIPPPEIGGVTALCVGQSGTIQVINSSWYSSFLWNSGATTPSIVINQPGTYHVTVTNSGGCTSSASISVGTASPPLLVATPTPSTCGQNNGAVNLNVTPPGASTFLWNGGQTTEDLANIGEGIYSVTVTSISTGCTATVTTTVDDIPAIITITGNVIQPSSGQNNGAIDISVSPSGTYTYIWSNGASSEDLSGLGPGTYTVTVSGGGGCSETATFVLSADCDLTVTYTITPPLPFCAGEEITLTLIPSGGTAPYTYLWTNGATTQSITFIAQSVITLDGSVTDANGCLAQVFIHIKSSIWQVFIQAYSSTCGQNNGIVDLTVTGGSTYDFIWSNGATTEDLINVAAGAYSVTVTGPDGCTATASAVVVDDMTGFSIAGNITQPSGGLDNGAIDITISPNGVYTYIWSNGATTQDLSGLAPGTYTVTVSSGGGCTQTAVYILADTTCPIIVDVTSSLMTPFILCPGETFTLTADASGGTSPYSYLWSSGQTTQSIILPFQPWGSNFFVTVTDANGCTGSGMIHLKYTEWEALIVIEPVVACLGETAQLEAQLYPNYLGSTFLWSTGETTNIITISANGTYSVTISNPNMPCTVDTTVDVNIFFDVPPPSPEIVGPPTLCPGQTATLSVNGGPYSYYFWYYTFGSDPTVEITGPGTYYVVVQNAELCDGMDSIVILPGSLEPILNSPTPICAGQSTEVEVINASAFDNFLWSNGDTGPSIIVSSPGIYSVTVTASGGCSATGSAEVLAINSNITIDGITTSVGSCMIPDGSVDLTITPSGNYSFNWSNGASTEDISSLNAGNYTVTVTDVGGCTSSASFTVFSNVAPPILSTSFTAATCGQNNGALDLSVAPSGTYTFLWSSGETTEDIAAKPSGNYSVTVTSTSDGCTSMTDAIIPDNPIAISLSGIVVPMTSCISQNGAIDISVNPSGAYSYQWSNGASTQDLSNIPAGTYSVTTTLGVTCTATETFVVANNTSPIDLTGFTTPNTSCTQPNGNIDITVSPSGSYTFIWSNGETTEDLQDLTGGSYSVTVTETNGCTATEIFEVVNTNSNYSLDGSVTPNNSCISPNGAIDLTISPVGVYTYTWSNGASTEDLQNLPSGTYLITVTDFNNCSSIAMFSITDTLTYPMITAALTPEACGGNTGAIDISVIPVNGNIFFWSNGSTNEDQTNLSAGNYAVTVTGSNGCASSDTFTLDNQNSNFTLTAVPVANNSCALPNGGIDLSLTPSGSYGFVWSNGATTEDLQNIPAGTYTVMVTDTLNCMSSSVFVVGDNTSTPVLSASIMQANCGANSGAIDLSVNPTGSNVFLWSNGEITEDLQNILPGSYSVIVTDINGCQARDTFDVQNINSNFSISAVQVENTACVNPSGSIDLSISPSGTYTFLWSNGSTTEDLINLDAGAFTVTVTDLLSCSSTATVVIGNNVAGITISSSTASATCGNDNGSILLTINPPAISFLWSNGATNEDLQNLAPGNYVVTITDISGCETIDSFFVPQAGSSLVIAATPVANTHCTVPDGSIDLSVSPTGAYTFVWSNGSTSEDQSDLAPGIYAVTITDINGCFTTGSYVVEDQTIPPSLTATITPETCGNANGQIDISVSPSGNHLFTWSNGELTEDLTDISAGTYSVTVTDEKSCTASMMVIVPDATSNFSISATTTYNTSCTAANGGVELTVLPVGNYSFLWSNGATTEDLQSLQSGMYTVTVTDLTNCSTTGSYSIDNAMIDLVVNGTITPMICGEPNGGIELNIIPPSGNSYAWSNGTTDQDLASVSAGTYSVTVTGQNGCTSSLIFAITESQSVEVDIEANLIDAGDDHVTISAQVNLPLSALDTIIWLPGNLFDCVEKFCLQQTIQRPSQQTEIIVMVIDTNGCTAQASLTLDAEINPHVFIPNVFSPNGDGINDMFTVAANEDVEEIVELRIFDRWGEIIFVNTHFPPNELSYGWDGSFKNAIMNPAVFVYWAKVRFVDGTEEFYKGDVTLLR